MAVDERQPLLLGGKRLRGTIGPGGQLYEIRSHQTQHQVTLDEHGNESCGKIDHLVRVVLSFGITLAGVVVLTRQINNSSTYRYQKQQLNPSPSLFRNQHAPPTSGPKTQWDGLLNDHPESLRVSSEREGFPSFWNFAPHGVLNVTYDERSFLINGKRTLFLGGTAHPARFTPDTWEQLLDEMVLSGLNLLTTYVFWSAHQPRRDMSMDWRLLPNVVGGECKDKDDTNQRSVNPLCEWTLADALRSAARRGFFIHLRIGPYTCAEYNYGGIPEWVPYDKPEMAMRRPNGLWVREMAKYVKETIDYISTNQLWAFQGGPIVLGQIENELGGEMEEDPSLLLEVDEDHRWDSPLDWLKHDKGIKGIQTSERQRNATLQDYADWCGALVQWYAPNVLWTMCNGLSAPNTILTCNGIGPECSQVWIEEKGQNRRIQVDTPAMWTEDEAGFQVWGESPSAPTDYFWGRTATDFARDTLRWFARGGTHLNYYCFCGGYNRGRQAASSITNMYASGAFLCSSGQRSEPKYSHLQELHQIIALIAPTLLNSPSALDKTGAVEILDQSSGRWIIGDKQRLFLYHDGNSMIDESRNVVFVENDEDRVRLVRLRHEYLQGTLVFQMQPLSAILVINGLMEFDSSFVNPGAKSFRRVKYENPVELHGWSFWDEEVLLSNSSDLKTFMSVHPLEHTDLMMKSNELTDFSWYQTELVLNESIKDGANLRIGTQESSAVSVFIDRVFIGAADNHLKGEQPTTLQIDLQEPLDEGSHELSILYESLGYFNLIGRWGASTTAKTKGITGDIILSPQGGGSGLSLVDSNRYRWLSRAGLRSRKQPRDARESQQQSACAWSRALFDTPMYDANHEALYLDMIFGRGRIYINGYDLGRFWNMTRGQSSADFTERYYFIPQDFLYRNGSLNELLVFDAIGRGEVIRETARLVLSWLEFEESSQMRDIVDYPDACL